MFHVEQFGKSARAEKCSTWNNSPFSLKWAWYQIRANEIFVDFLFVIPPKSRKFSTDLRF